MQVLQHEPCQFEEVQVLQGVMKYQLGGLGALRAAARQKLVKTTKPAPGSAMAKLKP
jgi:hypothetical protein